MNGGLDLYRYANSEPINSADPTGLVVRFGDSAGRDLWNIVRSVPEGARMADYLDSSPNEYVVFGDATLPGSAAGVTGDMSGEAGHDRREFKTCPSGRSVDLRVDSRKIRKALKKDPDIAGPAGRLAHEMLHASLIDFRSTGAPLPTSFLYQLLSGAGPNGQLDEVQHLFVENWSISRWGHR